VLELSIETVHSMRWGIMAEPTQNSPEYRSKLGEASNKLAFILFADTTK
jgi:hypothetical protein